ncbi:hypothetical protein [Azospirillum sp.]|uniref:hypothetical protein n=1 Tax=Azospirillum sp. TaxID=34012 RepID=UPI002613A590|nr:hypothetical protein [Azospirillum sp.]
MDPLVYFSESIADGKKLCLLPLGRNLLEEPSELCSGIVAYPPGFFSQKFLNIVSWPEYEFLEAKRKFGANIDAKEVIYFEGVDLQWFKSAATQINLNNFLGSTLVCISMDIDWDDFLSPDSHDVHLNLIKRASNKIEEAMDLIRFHYCSIVLPDTLPGRVGLLDDGPFSCAQFYNPQDHESYIVGGSILTHNIIRGVGLDMNGVTTFSGIGGGEVGNICRQALRMFSSALEANTETSKFVQCLSILEYLADPSDYLIMKNVKQEIGRHVARTKAEYNEIMEYFKYLTSLKDDNEKQIGLRTNIVHIGKNFEDLVPLEKDRDEILKRIEGFIGITINDFIKNSDKDWKCIVKIREDTKTRLGL